MSHSSTGLVLEILSGQTDHPLKKLPSKALPCKG